MKYYLLNNSLVVFAKDKVYSVSNDDYRFGQIKKAIDSGDFDCAASLVDPNFSLNKEGFIVDNGVVFYKDDPIPTVLGNRFVELKQDSFEFRSIFNFWFNMKTRVDDDVAADIIGELVHKDAYAVTEDGFYLLYRNKEVDQTSSVLNKKKQQEVFHFYNYANCPANYYSLFQQKKSLTTVLEEVFGFCSKKLRNIAVQQMFRDVDNFFNYKFLFYGETFKDVLATDNIFFAIENKLLDTNIGDINEYQDLKIFLKDYAVEKSGVYSQKKIINFLESATDKNKLMEIGPYYTAVKHQFDIDIQSMNFVNNCDTIHAYLEREYKRIQNPLFMLNNDPEIECLDEVEFDNFRIMIPKTNHDLIDWGNRMKHCVGNGSYANGVKKKEIQILSVNDKVTNEMMYTIDIRRKNLQQLLGRNNRQAPDIDRNSIVRFLREKNLIYKE